MKKLLGGLLILIGIVIGLYVGVYLLFWGGAVNMFHGITEPSFWLFIWGAIMWGLSGTVGWLCFAFPFAIGIALIDGSY